MNITHATRMIAGATLGLDKDARESLVVAVKGTFQIPTDANKEPVLAAKQVPLVTADEHTGEPGFSAVLYETEYAPIKKRCDVLFNGSAYAPNGRPVERVTVRLAVGPIAKSFDVVGQRTWASTLLGLAQSAITPFTVMPFSYNTAFGGIDKTVADPDKQKSYVPNHVGVGYHDNMNVTAIVGQPMPSTEETGKPITSPRGSYKPMAFGPILRVHPERVKYAGTYDQHWLDNVSPFLPSDFKEEYFQAAPADQQMDYPQGGEVVELTNLTPSGSTRFKLPTIDMPIEFTRRDGSRTELPAVMDTIVIEPDANRFTCVWRTRLPLKRNIFEVLGIVAGRMPPGFYRARANGKKYYHSLRDMVQAAQEDAA
jgi:hypothetical protein